MGPSPRRRGPREDELGQEKRRDAQHVARSVKSDLFEKLSGQVGSPLGRTHRTRTCSRPPPPAAAADVDRSGSNVEPGSPRDRGDNARRRMSLRTHVRTTRRLSHRRGRRKAAEEDAKVGPADLRYLPPSRGRVRLQRIAGESGPADVAATRAHQNRIAL